MTSCGLTRSGNEFDPLGPRDAIVVGGLGQPAFGPLHTGQLTSIPAQADIELG